MPEYECHPAGGTEHEAEWGSASDGRTTRHSGYEVSQAEEKRCELDRLYQRICDGLDALLRAVGLRVAA